MILAILQSLVHLCHSIAQFNKASLLIFPTYETCPLHGCSGFNAACPAELIFHKPPELSERSAHTMTALNPPAEEHHESVCILWPM